MLLERPAAGDVEELQPAADAEHRHVALERGAAEGDLEPVAFGVETRRHRVVLGAVERRVDVGAAAQHQPVEQVEQLVGALGARLVHRQEERQPAGLRDGA
jgi:hypothetical protein